MVELKGFFTLHRRLFEDPLWLNGTPVQKVLMVYLIGKANYKPKQWSWQGEKFEVGRGQLITSLDNLKRGLGKKVSTQNIRTALGNLEKYGFLTNKSTKTGRLITICNYCNYQDIDKKTTKKVTKTQQRGNKDLTPNNNNNNDNNDKKNKEDPFIPLAINDEKMELIKLTKKEYFKLIKKLGKPKTNAMVERLNDYIGSKGTKYKSHYHTILNWVRKDEKENGGRDDYEPPGRYV